MSRARAEAAEVQIDRWRERLYNAENRITSPGERACHIKGESTFPELRRRFAERADSVRSLLDEIGRALADPFAPGAADGLALARRLFSSTNDDADDPEGDEWSTLLLEIQHAGEAIATRGALTPERRAELQAHARRLDRLRPTGKVTP